ncbi:exported protein of unknown function [Rhodovastum atsumiense]|uniref:hypothetical protein n=1 Tax=Rhodovastum atsumiense TaxID=504468 RepID=UPI00139F2CCF|nr:hypothetical protein [Rhodovastum atsumiense]CAH2604023.1 exported protein of unknown function [Rhodovastum atsumiense]
MTTLLRAALLGTCLLPLAACFTYREVPVQEPAPVVITPPPAGSAPILVRPGTTP